MTTETRPGLKPADSRMAITPDGVLKPVSEFSAEDKWWCDGEEVGKTVATLTFTPNGDRPDTAGRGLS